MRGGWGGLIRKVAKRIVLGKILLYVNSGCACGCILKIVNNSLRIKEA